jgi:hypothetical protein
LTATTDVNIVLTHDHAARYVANGKLAAGHEGPSK